jgi:hypothetical protein
MTFIMSFSLRERFGGLGDRGAMAAKAFAPGRTVQAARHAHVKQSSRVDHVPPYKHR